MKNIFTVIPVFIFGLSVFAKEGEYAVSKIPADLLKKANLVKRAESIRFEITEKNRAKYFRKVAYTILNDQADSWAYFSAGYDKLRSIESFEGTLYDAAGIKIKTVKKGDIKDVSGNDESSLSDDNRVKWHSFFYKVYPYTIEYEIELHYEGTMFLPDWIPQASLVMSVQQSSITVISPVSNPLRYKMFNYKGGPLITENNAGKIYVWEVKNIPAMDKEYASPDWHKITTSVFMATEKFTLQDYEGSNASWKDFGRFVYDLKKDRDALPDEIKQKVHELIQNSTGTKEKIKKLYEYMQQNTRYISIQLGIGSWQPFDAKYVGTKKYGDCKALSNFMYALLKEAGIRSVYTVIGADDDDDYLITELPCSQFNHVILFVPDGKDTTWLECTSQTSAAGYLGSIGNRYAVAVDENGGTLVRTPKYGIKDNLQNRGVKAKLAEDGMLAVNINTSYKAIQQDRLQGIINNYSKDKVKEYLDEELDFATYTVNSFDYKENKTEIPEIVEKLQVTVDHYATISGKRLFIAPNIISRSNRKLKAEEERKFDIDLDFEYKDTDHAEIEIPEGYKPESVPQDAVIETKFGRYSASVKLEQNKIIYNRSMEQYSGLFPKTDYGELVKFYDAIYKADRNKIVFIRTGEEAKKPF